MTTAGTIIVPRMAAKQKLLPRNRSRANANAAGMLIASLPAVVTTAMNTLFQNQFATGKYSKASGKFDSVGDRGSERQRSEGDAGLDG